MIGGEAVVYVSVGEVLLNFIPLNFSWFYLVSYTIEKELSQNELKKLLKKFKYLGAMVSDERPKPEVIAKIAMTAATLTKLDIIWKLKSIKL